MKRFLCNVIMLVALAAAGQAFAQELANGQGQINDKNAVNTQAIAMLAPQRCFSSGSGKTFLKICITDNGNISWFESPQGVVHLNTREGYTACTWTVPTWSTNGFDANVASSGWGTSTVLQPNGAGTLPLIVTRQSLDGAIKLTQTFTINAAERGVDVKMDVTNLTPTSHDLRVSRYFDGDINGTTNNPYWFSDVSVWGWGPLNYGGLMLTPAPSSSYLYYPWVSSYTDWNPNGAAHQYARGCEVAGWAVQGDNVGGIVTQMYLNAGQTKTVTLRYRRF